MLAMALLLRALLVVVMLILPTGSARAVTRQVTLVGKVSSVQSPGGILTSYGVTVGARVDVTYVVDLAVAPQSQSGPPDNISHYTGAVSWMLIEVGDWLAMRLPPSGGGEINLASVADDSGANANVDLLSLTTQGTDNDLILTQSLLVRSTFNLSFADGFGFAGNGQTLDQDPTRYVTGTGSVYGGGGHVIFTIDTAASAGGSGGSNANPVAACTKSQLSAAAKLCQAQLKCEAKYEKAPGKDPLGAKRDLCLAKAGATFTNAYQKAAATAASKGLLCGTSQSAAAQAAAIDAEVDAILAEVAAVSPAYAPLTGAWLDAAASACGSSLGAEAKHVGKPNPTNLGKARVKAAAKLVSTADKAVAKAEKKGIVFAPAPDVTGFAAVIEAAIQNVLAAIRGG